MLSGCTLPWDDESNDGTPVVRPPTTPTPVDTGPPIIWGGTLLDARDGSPITTAVVRLDLSQTQPCRRQGVGWSSFSLPVHENGTFGPIETARPRSDDVAFFLHVTAPGYSENATFIGPTEARAGTDNITVILHPEATVEGRAPPGTVVALAAPPFPRLTVADADGRFAFANARVVEADFVAATDTPFITRVIAPATLDVPQVSETSWRLEGNLRTSSGQSVAADVVAYQNGTRLVSAARASDTGTFVLPLPSEPGAYRIEARSPDGRWGGLKLLELNGPPSLRENVLVHALC